uniref:Uncharacterized protein n=1 Tax=Arundo donax TaxID=35708 RepID=A0A0A8YYD2_ARUDO
MASAAQRAWKATERSGESEREWEPKKTRSGT